MFHTTYDEASRTWSGPKTDPLFNPNVSAAQVILNALNNNPNKIGQISDNNGIQMKNSEIRKKTIRAAQHLHKMGFGKDDVIGIVARNHHHLAPIVFASFALAAPLNPMDPNFKADDLVQIMQVTMPKVIFCDNENIATVQEALKKLDSSVPIFTFDYKVEGARFVDELFIDTGANINHFVPIDIGDGMKHLLVILCSSGTTGRYKSVCVSHAAALEQLHKCLCINGEDIVLDFNSLYSLAGFATLVAPTLNGATRVITTEVFQPELMVHIVEKYKVSVTFTSPGHLIQLVQCKDLTSSKLSSLVKYYVAGSTVPEVAFNRINQFLPKSLFIKYGMTEFAGTIASNFPEPRTGSVGKLISGCTTKIVDYKGNKCGIDEDGEICLLPKLPFLGYYGDAALTDAFVDSDGWFHTGDSGHFDVDGYLYVIDRLKDLITYRGNRMFPSEIEADILKHPGVTAVCVFGIPDAICTELPAAILMKDETVNVTEQDIIDRVKNTMSEYKQLRGGVYIVNSLPVTPFGKIIRRKCKDMAMELLNQRSKV